VVSLATHAKHSLVASVTVSLNALHQAFCISVGVYGTWMSANRAQAVAPKGEQKGTTIQTLRGNRGLI
jgi:hypothetical protein